MQLLTTDYSLTLPVWGWCLAVPVLVFVAGWLGYCGLYALAWVGCSLAGGCGEERH